MAAIPLRSFSAATSFTGAIRQIVLGHSIPSVPTSPSPRTGGLLAQLFPLGLSTTVTIPIPSLGSIWESILKAVPKKKTSHRKRRTRFLVGKALKDVTNLNKCSGCGNVKRAHHLCPYCVREIKDMWNGRGTVEVETQRREAKEEAMKGWKTVKERRHAARSPRR